ncbi:DUF2242 domain-containing protein [Variovorax sp. HJSM1_2]|uniref:DUF2242 domain-containing protein n=1 Tax=Variovorax sp. HJSM1_2 TaxID=3366263 RepID=UPI003BE4AAC0
MSVRRWAWCGLGGAVWLAGCSMPLQSVPMQENFNSSETFTRLFDASPKQTCEASRRALLSQGYVITSSSTEQVQGQKSFQPDHETHLQMEIRVVCAPESRDGQLTLGFVTALQDRYALKKSNNSASLGVGALGSVSVPLSASNDSMVRIASETISSEKFYDSFFAVVQRYLSIDESELGPAAPSPLPKK